MRRQEDPPILCLLKENIKIFLHPIKNSVVQQSLLGSLDRANAGLQIVEYVDIQCCNFFFLVL